MEPEAEIIRAQLFALQDEAYRTFHSALMPTVPPETVIGVRVPALRRLAKQLADTPEAEVFLQELPHFYYEENALHAFLLESVRDYGTALAARPVACGALWLCSNCCGAAAGGWYPA